MIKNINIPLNFKIFFLITSDIKYLVFSSEENSYKEYFRIPHSINISKVSNNTLRIESNVADIASFESFLFKQFRNIPKLFKKSIILKGLGLKASLKDNTLELKLGYSHPCLLSIPYNIRNISIVKNIITVEGFDLLTIGNFLNKIRFLKRPNIYKGKGVWYKNENITLKTIKKS
jgi:large subunit ribosomal protein L6